MNPVLIGADPEVFVKDRVTGKHISAYGMVQGDKANPFKVDKGAVQVDGMALEFNIDPAQSCEEFVDSVFSVMGTLQGMIKDEIDIVPVAEFGKDYIDSQPDKAKELGCEPDFNAYTGKVNATPDGNADFRTGAGHIHIGWTEGANILSDEHMRDCCFIVKALDNVLYVLSDFWDTDRKRMNLYGARGAFRPKSYGVEYRVLSNAWLKNKAVTEFVYRLTQEVMANAFEGKLGVLENKQRQVGRFLMNFQGYGGFREYMAYCGIKCNERLYISYVKAYEALVYEK